MLDRNFNFTEAEGRIYAAWEDSGAFRPSDEPGAQPYTIVIPPPNVTGSLHMGHALNNTLQDVLIRFERMRGKSVLWQPGTDHAGIATQMVVERQLAESGNQDRRSMGRDAFIDRVWKWKEESGGQIINQLKRLGASCDWSRERFTMDEGLSRAVLKVFVQLYNEGLIYRDKRLVNWDPKFETAISDLEVDNREVDGHFWHLKYPLADGATYAFPIAHDDNGKPAKIETRDYIAVATTRPETMLGDTGVAVHPDDGRYKELIGKFIDHPLTGRRIPIVADEHADPQQGSGAVKITPAHDFNDFEVGRRAGLDALSIFNTNATINANAPEAYRGLDRFDARKKVVEDLDRLGLLAEIEDKKITQPFGDRSGVVIEPMLTDQWYVNAAELAKPAIEAVEKGETKFVPENWTKTYYQWMRNIQPWCVSRQLWWGHRIPAWYGLGVDEDGEFDDGTPNRFLTSHRVETFCAERFEDAKMQAEKRYGKFGPDFIVEDKEAGSAQAALDYAVLDGEDTLKNHVYLWRDPDVLDTWFSSALWPFSTLGWPDALRDASSLHPEGAAGLDPAARLEGRRDEAPQGEGSYLEKYYPTSVLVTAFDIIFFWVARMMMMGLHFMKDEKGAPVVPFHTAYIHALVLDEQGQKMSKSKGNVIDPLVLIDKYGADALRFTLAAQAAQGRNIRLSEARVEGYRNFGTKLWNAARFCQMNDCRPDPNFDPAAVKSTLNQWIVHEANECAAAVTRELEAFRFNDAAGAIYRFTWNVFCDWYLELAKPTLQGADGGEKTETRAMTAWALDRILKLLHPFMPFVTEELWGAFAGRAMLIESKWPDREAGLVRYEASKEMQWVIDVVKETRSTRAEANIPPATEIKLAHLTGVKEHQAWLARHEELISRLARLSSIEDKTTREIAKDDIVFLAGSAQFAISLSGAVDVAAEKERLEKDKAKTENEIARIDKKLANKNFVERAPADVVEEQKTRRADYEAQREKLGAALSRLKGL